MIVALSVFTLSACEPEIVDNTPRPVIGNPSAPVLVEEFSDLQCPACAAISPILEEVVLENASIAQFKYRHFPLSQHQYAFKAAEAAECANEQGKFWEYAKTVFQNQSAMDEQNLKEYAVDLGLEPNSFNECLDSGRKKGIIKADMVDGRSRNLQATPSIYVNGQLVQWAGADAFDALLKSLAQ